MSPQNEPQKFMIKLPPKLHRQLMAYAGVKGEALSDIIVRWVDEVWAKQPEHEAIVSMVDKATTPEKKEPAAKEAATPDPQAPSNKRANKPKKEKKS